MIFACDRCGRRYSVPDERVQGRAFRASCKACGNTFVVRPGAPAAGAPPPAAPPPAAPRAVAPAPPPAPAPRAVAPAPPPAPAPRAAAPAPPPAPAPRAAAPAPPPRAPPQEGPYVDLGAELEAEQRRRESDSAEEPGDPFGGERARPAAGDRTLTAAEAAEAAWMSGAAHPGATAPGGEEGAPAERPEPRGPGVLRVALAGVVLGLAAAGAAWLLWPSPRPAPPARVTAAEPPRALPAPPPPAAAQPPPAPAVAAVPAPAPEALAPEPAVATAPAPAPAARTSSSARFEPGTVTVAPSRRKPGHALSRKDRKLLDLLARKADEAAPPEPVEKLDLDTGASLDPAAVERVMTESQGAFSGCISRTSRPGQEPGSRRATLLLTVSSTGAVSAAGLAEADVSRTLLGRCIVTAARRLVFPSFEGEPVDVSVPLLLQAR